MAEGTLSRKDPQDLYPISLDFRNLLDRSIDEEITAINSVTVWKYNDEGELVASVGELTATDPTIVGSIVKVVISGGVSGTTYSIAFHVTTSTGAEYERSVDVPCENR